ncbi:MAG: hypothetical protein LIV11_10725 [Bacillota bacterium]|nr:hypothetical protein [Bacillota bacterium]
MPVLFFTGKWFSFPAKKTIREDAHAAELADDTASALDESV